MAAIKNASEAMATLSSAVGFTTLPGNAQAALVAVNTKGIHYRIDGGTPTSTVGMPVAASSTFQVVGRNNLENFKVIEDSASADIYVTYYDHVDF